MRRPDGAGTKETLPSGKVRTRVRVDGKRVDHYWTSDADASEHLSASQALLASGRLSTRAPTLGDWGRTWLDNLTNRSADSDRSRWRTLVAPAPIAKLELRDIGRPEVVAYVDWLGKQRRLENTEGQGQGAKHSTAKAKGDKPLSPQTKRHGLALLRRCLGAAADRGKIQVNPALGVRFPRRDAERVEEPWTYLEQAEIDQLLGCALLPEDVRLRYQVFLYTGVRPSEAWAWDWLDVAPWAWQKGRPVAKVRKGRRGGPTKSGKPREVPLLPKAAAALRRLWVMAGQPKKGLIFPAPKGGRRGETDDGGWTSRTYESGNVRDGHKEIAGITRPVRLYDLRHSFASHLAIGTWGRQWSLEEIMEVMGHSSITVTQRYAHLRGALHGAAAATSGPAVVHDADPEEEDPPSVGPVGLEPTTNGLKGLREVEGSREVGAPHGPDMDRLARHVLARAAAGSASRADLEKLARAVLADRPVKLAREVLKGGEWQLAAGLELAGEVLRRAVATPAPASRRRA